MSKPGSSVGSTIPGRFWACLLLAVAVLSLAGCSGGDAKRIVDAIAGNPTDNMQITPSGNDHGAFAFAWVTVNSSPYVWGRGGGRTLSEAENSAIAFCEASGGEDCMVALSFSNQCGALAIGDETVRGLIEGEIVRRVGKAGVGAGTTRSAAETEAIQSCRSNGGENCRIAPSAAGTPASFCTD